MNPRLDTWRLMGLQLRERVVLPIRAGSVEKVSILHCIRQQPLRRVSGLGRHLSIWHPATMRDHIALHQENFGQDRPFNGSEANRRNDLKLTIKDHSMRRKGGPKEPL